MSRYVLSARDGASAPISKFSAFKTPSAPSRDVLPRVTMPQSGVRILFWRGGASHGDGRCPGTAERIKMLRRRLDHHRASLSEIEARIADDGLSPDAMQAEHKALSALLTNVTVEEARIKTIRETLRTRQVRFLASWRVTEREILATESREAHRDVCKLLCRIKRCQVDISGRLLDAG